MPFTREQFFELFVAYNAAIWPAEVVAYLLGIAAVLALVRPGRAAGQLISAILAILWLWTGLFYHMVYFARINPAAYVFGALFVAQAALFVLAGVSGSRLAFRSAQKPVKLLGAALIAYALVIYELLGLVAGHGLMQGPLFGVAPCPTVIFTLGVLVLAEPPVPWWLLPIPLAWAVIGTSAALTFGVAEDLGLAVAAVLVLVSLQLAGRQNRPS